ncbi:MAG: hypothetical protein EKK64_04930 [Neisseriaceae bacterium]|nr:MAG: hypothetical protein EKK64_04930 [Neisseriaceae bacterium]
MIFSKWLKLNENFSLLPQNPIEAEEFLRDVIEIVKGNKDHFLFYHNQKDVMDYAKSISSLITDEISKRKILNKLEIQWQDTKHKADALNQSRHS